MARTSHLVLWSLALVDPHSGIEAWYSLLASRFHSKTVISRVAILFYSEKNMEFRRIQTVCGWPRRTPHKDGLLRLCLSSDDNFGEVRCSKWWDE